MNHSVSVCTAGLLKTDAKARVFLPLYSQITESTSSYFPKITIKIAKITTKCLSLPDTGLCEYFFFKQIVNRHHSHIIQFHILQKDPSQRASSFSSGTEEPGLPVILSAFPGNCWFLCSHLSSCPASLSPWQEEHRGHGKRTSVV